MKFFNKLIRDEQGATAIEYGLIAALIAVAAITAMQGLGNQLEQHLQHATSAELADANDRPPKSGGESAYTLTTGSEGRQGNLPPFCVAPSSRTTSLTFWPGTSARSPPGR